MGGIRISFKQKGVRWGIRQFLDVLATYKLLRPFTTMQPIESIAGCEETASALSLFSRVSDLVALSFYLDSLEPFIGSSSLCDSLKVLDSSIPRNLPFGLLVIHKRSQLDIHMDPKSAATNILLRF